MPKFYNTKTQSNKSVRSNKSRKSVCNQGLSDTYLFSELVAASIVKFDCPYRTVVKKDYQLDEFLKATKYASGRLRSTANTVKAYASTGSQKDGAAVDSDSRLNMLDSNTVVITAIYDNLNKLCEILLLNQKILPRDTMQIIGIIAPNFSQLTRLSIKRCRINGYTIYEMNRFLPLTSITEICLDDSPLHESNYKMLLDKPCRITSLSLSRCQIYDDHCEEIASMLHFSEPAEATLTTLNLSSNHITDVGAASIGEALRSNRHLRYLNLAGNRIGDDGTDRILDALIDFILTDDEILNMHQMCLKYQKLKQETYLKYRRDWDTKSTDSPYNIHDPKARSKRSTRASKAKTSNKMSEAMLHLRATLSMDIVGLFFSPFSEKFTKIVDGFSHCFGNMILCYLNLSYNSLTYATVKRIVTVLTYQNSRRQLGEMGLLKILIDGNPTPVYCDEYEIIGYFLQKNVTNFSPRYVPERGNRKSRVGKIPPILEKR